jgi:hypothetical protein
MYYNDHARPHFHAGYGDAEMRVNIIAGEVISGDFPRRAERLVLEGYEIHKG